MRTLLVSSKLEQNKGDKMFVVLKQKKKAKDVEYICQKVVRQIINFAKTGSRLRKITI